LLSPAENASPSATLPATLSPKVLTGLLRGELMFKGLVVTDAMEMAGIAARYDSASSAVLAVKAGADMILKIPDMDAASRAIKDAVGRGEISESNLNASVERILLAKAGLGLDEHRTVDLNGVDRVISDPQFNSIAQEIADRSITLVRNDNESVPLGRRRLLSIAFTDEANRAVAGPFIEELRRGGAEVESTVLDNRSTAVELEYVRARLAETVDPVIYSLFVPGPLPPLALRLAEQISKIRPPAVVISFGNPYLLTAIPKGPAYIAAYGPHPVSQRAAARAMLGNIDISGRLPVTLPGLYPRGHGLELKHR